MYYIEGAISQQELPPHVIDCNCKTPTNNHSDAYIERCIKCNIPQQKLRQPRKCGEFHEKKKHYINNRRNIRPSHTKPRSIDMFSKEAEESKISSAPLPNWEKVKLDDLVK